MSYVVTVCDSCQAVALVPVPRATLPPCESCDSSLRTVPTRIFHENERTMFQLLSVAVAASDLSALEASKLSVQVTWALMERKYAVCWSELSNRLPALGSWEQVLGVDARAHEKVLELLRTIFDAISTCRSSGVLATVRPELEGPGLSQHPSQDVRSDQPKKSG